MIFAEVSKSEVPLGVILLFIKFCRFKISASLFDTFWLIRTLTCIDQYDLLDNQFKVAKMSDLCGSEPIRSAKRSDSIVY
jgi:hypothetical protein